MAKNFFDRTDSEIATGSANFYSLINSDPVLYGLVAGQATSYGVVNSLYQTNYQLAIDPSTRTPVAIQNKNLARASVKNSARLLANIIKATSTVTDGELVALGLTPRASSTPVPIPQDRPILEIQSVQGNVVNIILHGNDSNRRGLPPRIAGANVYSFIGENPPVQIDDWRFEGNTSKSRVRAEFSVLLPAFSRVWFTAQWYNNRTEVGPACIPVATNLGSWIVQQAA